MCLVSHTFLFKLDWRSAKIREKKSNLFLDYAYKVSSKSAQPFRRSSLDRQTDTQTFFIIGMASCTYVYYRSNLFRYPDRTRKYVLTEVIFRQIIYDLGMKVSLLMAVTLIIRTYGYIHTRVCNDTLSSTNLT